MNKAIKLIGREPEIEKLNRILASGEAGFLPYRAGEKQAKHF